MDADALEVLRSYRLDHLAALFEKQQLVTVEDLMDLEEDNIPGLQEAGFPATVGEVNRLKRLIKGLHSGVSLPATIPTLDSRLSVEPTATLQNFSNAKASPITPSEPKRVSPIVIDISPPLPELPPDDKVVALAPVVELPLQNPAVAADDSINLQSVAIPSSKGLLSSPAPVDQILKCCACSVCDSETAPFYEVPATETDAAQLLCQSCGARTVGNLYFPSAIALQSRSLISSELISAIQSDPSVTENCGARSLTGCPASFEPRPVLSCLTCFSSGKKFSMCFGCVSLLSTVHDSSHVFIVLMSYPIRPFRSVESHDIIPASIDLETKEIKPPEIFRKSSIDSRAQKPVPRLVTPSLATSSAIREKFDKVAASLREDPELDSSESPMYKAVSKSIQTRTEAKSLSGEDSPPHCTRCGNRSSPFIKETAVAGAKALCEKCGKLKHGSLLYPTAESLKNEKIESEDKSCLSLRQTLLEGSYLDTTVFGHIHFGVHCAGIPNEEGVHTCKNSSSGAWIRGVRFQCMTCCAQGHPEVNFCSSCIKTLVHMQLEGKVEFDGFLHDNTHVLLALIVPKDCLPSEEFCISNKLSPPESECSDWKLTIDLLHREDILNAVASLARFPGKVTDSRSVVIALLGGIDVSDGSGKMYSFWRDYSGNCGVRLLDSSEMKHKVAVSAPSPMSAGKDSKDEVSRASKASSDGHSILSDLSRLSKTKSMAFVERALTLRLSTAFLVDARLQYRKICRPASLGSKVTTSLSVTSFQSFIMEKKMAQFSSGISEILDFFQIRDSGYISEKQFVEIFCLLCMSVACMKCNSLLLMSCHFCEKCTIVLCSSCSISSHTKCSGHLRLSRVIDVPRLREEARLRSSDSELKISPDAHSEKKCLLTKELSKFRGVFYTCSDCSDVSVCEGCMLSCHRGHYLVPTQADSDGHPIETPGICQCRSSGKCLSMKSLADARTICAECNAEVDSFFIVRRKDDQLLLCSLCLKKPHAKPFFPTRASMEKPSSMATRLEIQGPSKKYFGDGDAKESSIELEGAYTVHWGVRCSNAECKSREPWIRGLRFVCAICWAEDNVVVNLCHRCVCVCSAKMHADGTHSFVALSKPQDCFPKATSDMSVRRSFSAPGASVVRLPKFSSQYLKMMIGEVLRGKIALPVPPSSGGLEVVKGAVAGALSAVLEFLDDEGDEVAGSPHLHLIWSEGEGPSFNESMSDVSSSLHGAVRIMEILSRFMSKDVLKIDLRTGTICRKGSVTKVVGAPPASSKPVEAEDSLLAKVTRWGRATSRTDKEEEDLDSSPLLRYFASSELRMMKLRAAVLGLTIPSSM